MPPWLRDLDRWRLTLARAIRERNDLGLDRLDRSTRILLERVLLLRLAEAKGVVPRGVPSLQDVLRAPGPVLAGLLAAFAAADERGVPGPFDDWVGRGRPAGHGPIASGPAIADAPLRSIVADLYLPSGAHLFAAAPADLLGAVHERFLAKRLVVAPSGGIGLEPKREIRRRTGIFYTPGRIVRYMVKAAIGRWIDEHRADDLRSIRICDPACGSGAFLVAAYLFLLEAHVRRYARRRDLAARYLVDRGDGVPALALSERRRILRDCIFGIDVDPVAVAIARSSLLLAMLEGEPPDGGGGPLPDLANNLLCANSLLAPADFRPDDPEQGDPLDALDWDASPATAPGFDIWLGNPPFLFGERRRPVELRAVRARLRPIRQVDLYHAFLDLVIRRRRPDGYWSLIVPDAVLARDDAAPLRALMLEQGDLQAAHVGRVFAEAAVSCVVLTQGPSRRRRLEIHSPPAPDGSWRILRTQSRRAILSLPDKGFRLSLGEEELRLLGRLRRSAATLADLVLPPSRGEEYGKKDLRADVSGEPCIVGEDIEPFRLRPPRLRIAGASVRKSRAFYGAPKAVAVKTGLKPKTAIDRDGFVTLQSVYNLHPGPGVSVELIAAVLNSRVAGWFLAAMYTSHKKLFPQINQRHLLEVPLPDRGDEARIVEAVRLIEACGDAAERAILAGRLDALVTSAYGLTEREQELVLAAG